MVLLTFSCQDKADSFYADFNGNFFSSLEPEILCRWVGALGLPSLWLQAGKNRGHGGKQLAEQQMFAVANSAWSANDWHMSHGTAISEAAGMHLQLH